MKPKYDRPSDIPDQDIINAFNAAETVRFSARRFNFIRHRSIALPGLGWWLPLTRVLPLVGITPEMLVSVMGLAKEQDLEQARMIGGTVLKRTLSHAKNKKLMHRFRFVRNTRGLTYADLGRITLSKESFVDLARVLNKNIEVHREDGGTGEHYHLFTACVSGEIKDPSGIIEDTIAA